MLRFLLLLISIAGAILVLTALTSKLYRIPTSSMEPNLHCPKGGGSPGCRGDEADRIAVSRVVYKLRDPRRGDIVAYKLPDSGAEKCGSQPGSTFVHRIVGLPGERVAGRNGNVLVNGKRLREPYVRPGRKGDESFDAIRVGKGRYVVLGDNRNASCDSRVWGTVPRKRIIGPRIATYWPLDRISVSIG